jgi:hypothetical protein
LEKLEQGGFMMEEKLTSVLFVQTTHGHHSLVPQLIIHGEVEEPLSMSRWIILKHGVDDLPIFQTLIKKVTKYQLPVDPTVQVTLRIHLERDCGEYERCFDHCQWCNDKLGQETLLKR